MGTIRIEVVYRRGLTQTKTIQYEASGESKEAVTESLRKSAYGVKGWVVQSITQMYSTFKEVQLETTPRSMDDSKGDSSG